MVLECRLEHVGAAASVSGGQSMAWVSSDQLVYASHALLHVTSPPSTVQLANGVEETVRRPVQTLRTSSLERTPQRELPLITAVAMVKDDDNQQVFLVSGFSNGMLQVWEEQAVGEDEGVTNQWVEHPALPIDMEAARSITTLDAVWATRTDFVIALGDSSGVSLLHVTTSNGETIKLVSQVSLTQVSTAIKTVNICWTQTDDTGSLLLLVGTASPRYNRIHVYTLLEPQTPFYIGSLSGHEDWINSFHYACPLLASGSQDARIRLWRFRTTKQTQSPQDPLEEVVVPADYDDEEAESRLHWTRGDMQTSVTLEALLYGHEESVTAVVWHPAPNEVFQVPAVLISSSMDRIILLWAEGSDGVWAPLSRVGSAGGILGGSVGSSLLGYNSVTVDPLHGHSLIGHAYGGTLHVWNLKSEHKEEPCVNGEALTVEGRMQKTFWETGPSITGHFAPVTDMCWDAGAHGDFFFSVSADQTCRLWARLPSNHDGNAMWMELARPQVHGHDLAAVASISSVKKGLLLATGAEEKEIRVFEGPKTACSILQAACGILIDSSGRADRAFIPSLGLSNKASAVDAAEEDEIVTASTETLLDSVDKMHLPQERDLGAVSLWPESQKLFGHNTEIYCLASTAAGINSGARKTEVRGELGDDCSPVSSTVLLASSGKAREPEDAQIRLWDAEQGTCFQVLQQGHKSTVATMCFSPSGRLLISSGKDRRLCCWRRIHDEYKLCWAKDGAHKRIIWSVDFCPFKEDIFASGSRDGTVKIWKIRHGSEDDTSVEKVGEFSPDFQRSGKPDAVTAVAFAPIPISSSSEGQFLLAIGLDSGRIEFWTYCEQTSRARHVQTSLRASDCHVATVTRLAWRIPTGISSGKPHSLLLGSSSMDHSCRVFKVTQYQSEA